MLGFDMRYSSKSYVNKFNQNISYEQINHLCWRSKGINNHSGKQYEKFEINKGGRLVLYNFVLTG